MNAVAATTASQAAKLGRPATHDEPPLLAEAPGAANGEAVANRNCSFNPDDRPHEARKS